MPIIQIDSGKLKEGLKKLGVPAVIAAAIVAYFIGVSPVKYMTYKEYRETIKAYNAKITEIKNDCQNDKRCIIEDGQNRVIFAGVESKQDVLIRLNKWIEEDAKNPKEHKIKK
jgi:hypothetical protein